VRRRPLGVLYRLIRMARSLPLAHQLRRAPDGSYTAQTTLEAKARNIRIVVENSGHRPLAK